MTKMNRAERKRAALRAGLEAEQPFVAVGAHDAMSSQLIEAYGFDAVWVSGFGVATMTHALPDLNLTTMNETLAASVRIDGATDLPVLADCDNGFGGLTNLVRRSEEHTSELQSRQYLVCRLLLEKKKKYQTL